MLKHKTLGHCWGSYTHVWHGWRTQVVIDVRKSRNFQGQTKNCTCQQHEQTVHIEHAQEQAGLQAMALISFWERLVLVSMTRSRCDYGSPCSDTLMRSARPAGRSNRKKSCFAISMIRVFAKQVGAIRRWVPSTNGFWTSVHLAAWHNVYLS